MRLTCPPDAEHGADHAAVAVVAAREVLGVDLDYSEASLHAVDDLLESFADSGSDAMAESIFALGAYVGEVLVRVHGYRWGSTPESEALGFPIAAVGPSGDLLNPIGKAFKRVDNGSEDSVAYFVRALARRGDSASA